MSLSNTFITLMDKARKITGLTEKISIARLINLMDHFDLHVNPNLLNSTEFEIPINISYPSWSATDLHAPLTNGQTYTLSWQAKTSGTNKKVRIRIWKDNNHIIGDYSGMAFPLTSSRQSYTFNVPNDGISYLVYVYGSAADVKQDAPVTLYNVKLEVGDLATPLSKVGG